MSLIVAIKDKGRVVFGADKQVSTGANKDHTCTKVWQVEELPGAIMGSVGTARGNQIIQYNQIIDRNAVDLESELETAFIVNRLVPAIVGTLKNSGISCEMPETKDLLLPNAFLFAYKSRAWMIWHDLSVMEVVDYLAIGSGSDVATGALYATMGGNPFERIVTCIDAAAESTLYVDNGVDLLVTEGRDGDLKQMKKALDIEDFEEEMPEPVKDTKAGAEKKTPAKKKTSSKKSTKKTTE